MLTEALAGTAQVRTMAHTIPGGIIRLHVMLTALPRLVERFMKSTLPGREGA
jgi:hypothetical protein